MPRAPALVRGVGVASALVVSCAPGAVPPRNVALDDSPSFVIVHAKLFTGAVGQSTADAVAVRGAAIAAVGSSDDLARRCAGACTIVDVAGGFVMPGFHDAHAHPFAAGAQASRLSVRSASVTSIQAAVKSYAAAHPLEPWILGHGWFSAAFSSWPTALDLDSAESTRPVVLTDTSGHNVWVNSAALSAAGITAGTPDPPGGRIAHPLGVLLDFAQLLVTRKEPRPTDDAIRAAIRAGQSQLLAVGVTSFAEGGTESLRVAEMYAKLDREGALRQRVFLWAPLHAGEADFSRWLSFARGLPPSGKVRVVAFKGFADGTMVAHTSAMLEPYADAPTTAGNLYSSQSAMNALVVRANAAGFPAAIHAIGDRAVRQALDAFEHSRATLHHGLVNRVEHAAVVDPADIPRFASIGVAASVQPVWLYAYPSLTRFTYLQRLGEARAGTIYPWRALASGGAPLVFGSDMPSSNLFDPVSGIYAAMTRSLADGTAFEKSEAVDRDVALRAYTQTAPEIMGMGSTLGRLAPGQAADILWLDHDPRAGARSITDDPVRRIWIAGVETPIEPG